MTGNALLRRIFFLTASALVACEDATPQDPDSGDSTQNKGQNANNAAFNVQCDFHTRPSETEPLSGPVTLKAGDDAAKAEQTAGDFQVAMSYLSDKYEGTSLSVSVTFSTGGGHHHLYQIDRTSPPSNVFVGNHGFTGLTYVRHPTTGAELQYICKVL